MNSTFQQIRKFLDKPEKLDIIIVDVSNIYTP
jgi:hypothetical protein